MATPTTWRLLPVLLVTFSYRCCSASGPPALPSNLECYRPCDQKDCSVIKCIWDPKPHPGAPTIYNLHWKPENAEDEHVTNGSSSDGLIHRENFVSHGNLRVWVQARNEFGSVNSQEIVIHTQDIIKPPPPTAVSIHQDPLEIHWSSICGELQLSVGLCDVRYRTRDHQNWIQYVYNLSSSFAVMEPQPNIVYEFQVRCQCDSSLISDWSPSYTIKSAESAPVGEVDAWWDCGQLLSSFDCFLNWKARGYILGYEVKFCYNNGTVQQMNVSTDDPSSLFLYDKMKWRLNLPLKDMSSVNVSAYNALGATKASPLPMPTSGKQANEPTIYLDMNEQNLTVSWNLPSKFFDSVKQYVVQYKECQPGNSFDWIKVDKNQTTAFFRGAFKRYTSYQVSLFAVSNFNEVSQLAAVRGYSVQGVPSRVPSFGTSHFSGTGVTLFWEPVPSSNQKGVILYYQIGLNTQKVYNVSVTPDQGNMTFKLRDLSPGQEYKVWIRAVTVAGPGAEVITTFKINHDEDYVYLIVTVVVLAFLCLFGCMLCFFLRTNKMCPVASQCLHGKVPDPSNSHIFRQMKHQINEPLTWICDPHNELYPSISVLEVVEKKEFDPDRMRKKTSCYQMDFQDDEREDPITENSDSTDGRYGRKEYSKMVDLDEEKNDCWSSSEEEQSTSGYEKHFMPSALEIMVE